MGMFLLGIVVGLLIACVIVLFLGHMMYRTARSSM